MGRAKYAVQIAVLTVMTVLLTSAQDAPDLRAHASSRSVTHQPVTHSTAIGGLNTVRLKDGSKAVLGTSTTFRTETSPDSRDGELVDGEMVLQIEQSPENPYELTAGPLTVECPGGEIHIRQDGGVLIFNQLAGQSTIRPTTPAWLRGREFKPITLPAGKSLELRAGVMMVSEFDPTEVERKLEWRQGKLVFVDEPLTTVVNEFNRYNAVKLVVSDPGIGEFKIGGKFQTTDVEGLVTSLESLGEPPIKGVSVKNADGTRSVLLVLEKKS